MIVRYYTKVIDVLCFKNYLVLKSMGTRFIAGYISLAEGEKDPRNLMVAFAIARVILIEFDFPEHVEVGIFIPFFVTSY